MKETTVNHIGTRTVDPSELASHIERLSTKGYTIVERLLAPETTAALFAATERHYAASRSKNYAGRPDRDVEDKMVYNLQNKDKLFVDILDLPVLQSVLIHFLNDPYYRFLPPTQPNYILGYYNARSSGKHLDLHIDSHIPFKGEKTNSMQAAFVLEEHTPDNGCTVVVPGSHQSGTYTNRAEPNVTPLLLKPGDVAFWDSRLCHGTRANTSQKSRWTLIATFTTWWVKQSMDMTRSLPDEIYRQLSDSQKALLGFCSIPPADEAARINTKAGFESLRPSVADYYR